MEDYKVLYFFLFNGISDVVKEMESKEPDEKIEKYIISLRQLQSDAEEKIIA